MDIRTACAALSQGDVLEIDYNGHRRAVEVHAVGVATTGNIVMRVFQVAGGSSSGELGWKLMILDKAVLRDRIAGASMAPRPGYQPDDAVVTEIFCRV